jgi:hypothetical protein
MIAYKWSIEKVKVTGDTNVVTQVYWRCDAKDEDLTAASAGISELTLGDTFTAYDQLTEQQVLDWCLPSVQNKIETELADRVQEQLDRVKSEPALPWVKIPA